MDQYKALAMIHESIGTLAKLRFLSLRECTNLVTIPDCLNVPDAIGELRFLERLNLQGNNFTIIPSTIKGLSNLSYLNLSHCHRLRDLPDLQPEAGPSNSVGEYFKTTSGSRDH
ncbi:putative TIR-NBS-LRR resistance protein, partial [Trifolium pratense]